MTLFEALSIAAICIGAAWGLVERHSKLQIRVEDLKVEGTADAIRRLERLIEKLETRMDAMDHGWGLQFANLSEKVNNLKVTLASVTSATSKASDGIEEAYRNFNVVLAKMVEHSTLKEIGQGYQRVSSTKKPEGKK
jgi:hypothetical protein